MELPPDTNACLAAFAAGVAAHILIFRVGEWDLWVLRLFSLFLSIYAVGVAVVFGLDSASQDAVTLVNANICIFKLVSSYLSGIIVSMIIYRGIFHRLRRFPGPLLARFSNLYATFLTCKRLHWYEEVQKLHGHYGDIVRLAPMELSVCNVEGMDPIYGPQSKCSKGPYYNITRPMVSLHTIRDKSEHIQRRRVWDRSFSVKALRGYEDRVTGYANDLLQQIKRREGQPVNVTEWFNFYSFTVMMDLAWGKTSNMLRDGVNHGFVEALHEFMSNVGRLSHLVWMMPVLKSVPILNRRERKWGKWIRSQVAERRRAEPQCPDVFSWILEAHNRKKASVQDELNLIGDAQLIAIAGSDTTSACLTTLFYELALRPSTLIALQAELDAASSNPEELTPQILAKLPYLNATINECLRLHPPVPSGVQRITPSEGLTIGSTFIPGNSIVQIPTHTIQRDPRYFDQPNKFLPERWTSAPELVKDARAFAPFSIGRYSCVGKELGLMEVRYVTAQIVLRYHVKLSADQSARTFLENKVDAFTLALGSLDLIFEARK